MSESGPVAGHSYLLRLASGVARARNCSSIAFFQKVSTNNKSEMERVFLATSEHTCVLTSNLHPSSRSRRCTRAQCRADQSASKFLSPQQLNVGG